LTAALVLGALFLITPVARAQEAVEGMVIKRVDVCGLETISEAYVRRVIKTREGQPFRRAQVEEDVRELLRQAGPFVTRQLVYQISQEASAIYADIMDDHVGRLNWSEDYDLSLEIKGRVRGFRQFSGGEQMSAALALRLALLRKTSNIDVAFFDEPTAHLDLERRDGLADKIMQVKGFSQVFVISHDDTFERAAHHYIHIVKDGGGSRLDDAGGLDGARLHQG
jgi:exonuclease SbcC